MTAVLECRDLVAGHGSVAAVRTLNLSVESGTVVAILGPNGAGKTTLLETIAGLLPMLRGAILLDGHAQRSGRAQRANRNGIILVPDDRALFESLTVRDNLRLAVRRGTLALDEIGDLFPALTHRWDVAAGAISGGEQQMLAMARALVQKPKVLLVDEMSTGLAPIVVETLLPVVREIAHETRAVVVLVEQHVRLALEVADTALVLVHGDVSLEGAASELAADPAALEAAYLGGSSTATDLVL